MGASILDLGCTIQCPHGGQATVSPSNTDVKVGGNLALLITDVMMPDMDGPELVRQMSLVRPETRTLFMSGYTDDALGDRGVLPSNVNFIQKPFSPKAIAQRVRDILDSAALGR